MREKGKATRERVQGYLLQRDKGLALGREETGGTQENGSG